MKKAGHRESARQRKADQLLLQGLAHHRQNQLEDADRFYASVLEQDPRHPDALHLSGVRARQRGDLDASLRLITEAICQNPTMGLYHHNLACTLTLLKRDVDAVASLLQALQLNPGDLESMLMLAERLILLDRQDEALAVYQQICALAPRSKEAYLAQGGRLAAAGDLDAAIAAYDEAVQRFPGAWEVHFGLGLTLCEARRLPEAREVFERVTSLNPGSARSQGVMGLMLHRAGELEAARSFYVRALRLDANDTETLSNLGALLIDQDQLAAAEGLLRRAIELEPDSMNAYSNLATTLTRQGKVAEAVTCFQKVLMKNPKHVPALSSLGFLHDSLGDEAGAEAFFKLAFEAEPEAASAQFNLSASLLSHGDFARGWSFYERRWELRQFIKRPRRMLQPQWAGEAIRGKRIFLYPEQGLGDTLQCARYVPLLAARGAEVILEVQPGLERLMRSVVGVAQVHLPGQYRGNYDVHCPLMSLPRAFGTDLSNIPADVPYLAADPTDVERWAERLDATGLRVGLVWSGNPAHSRDRLRSIQLQQLREVLAVPGVHFYALQKGPGLRQLPELPGFLQPVVLDAELKDFGDTAAAIANLDLVIAVDTAVAHLAGALGKPVWILVAKSADWRWLRDRTDSPWYPTAKLFRQQVLGDWSGVVEQLRADLEALAAGKTGAGTRFTAGAWARPEVSPVATATT